MAVNGNGNSRPYRLWDPKEKRSVPHRYYQYPKRAHMAALIEVRWGKPGFILEVINADTGRLLGVYLRHPTTVSFRGG